MEVRCVAAELAGIYPELTGIRRRLSEEAAARRNLPPPVRIVVGSTSTAKARSSTGKAEQATGGLNQGGVAPKNGRGPGELTRPCRWGRGVGRGRRGACAAAGDAGLNRGWAGAPGSTRSGWAAPRRGKGEARRCRRRALSGLEDKGKKEKKEKGL
uniref:Uncharacterized protein n=1 Tax=Triticum aestivum TaxID=4565 RepID=A0A077S0X6_WHEAT|nr:unnamed protein product [Triticum aestivum]